MQKKLDISLTIDNKLYRLTLTKTQLTHFDSVSFFDAYPHLYFSPKDDISQIMSSGMIYQSCDFIHIQSDYDIPSFFVGDSQFYPAWGDLGRAIHIIPQKWVIKRNHRIVSYEFNIKSLPFKKPKIKTLGHITHQSEALEAIETIKTHINNHCFAKCVLAIMDQQACHHKLCIDAFKHTFKSGTQFFYKFAPESIFMGMSPEWLYKRFNNTIMVDAVAGTCLKDAWHELFNDKISDEFGFVKKDIEESLAPYLLEGRFFQNDTILVTGHLAHRFNQFYGLLKKAVSEKTLVNLLHPTAAISGYPKSIVKNYIPSFESFERGYYAAPLGYYMRKKAYITIAIRSMLIDKDTAYLFAGAGITKDSQSTLEWAEFNHKLLAMKTMLNKG